MTDLQDAEKMGREAFAAGREVAPSLNKEFLEKHIAGEPIGGRGVVRMKAYIAGWTAANLAANVPGWTDEENAAMQRARKENKS